MLKVNDIRHMFAKQYGHIKYLQKLKNYNTLALVGACFHADEDTIFGDPNTQYIKDEIAWYESQSTNIYDLREDPPKAWINTANKKGEINSNYGKLIYSKEYYLQFLSVVNELIKDPESRRAVMIYNRPSMWHEYNEDGKNDFICTNAVSYSISRSPSGFENILNIVVQMRSNDIVLGYKNDLAWQKHVGIKICENINEVIKGSSLDMFYVKPGKIIWQVQNLHMYKRDYPILSDFITEEMKRKKKEKEEEKLTQEEEQTNE